MHIDQFSKKSIILIVSLSIILGVYKIATLACVSNDSVTFLNIADQLKYNPANAILENDQHPGYPFLINLSQHTLKLLGFTLNLDTKILAGQIINLMCRILALCCLFKIFCFFANKRIALLNIILLMLVPRYMDNGADCLSDWSSMLFMSLSIMFFLIGLKCKSFIGFMLTGLCSGVGYLIRPECLIVSLTAISFLSILLLSDKNIEKRKTIISIMCIGLSTIIIISPYMIYKKAIFPKKNVGTFSSVITTQNNRNITKSNSILATLSIANITVKGTFSSLYKFIQNIFDTLFILGIPLLLISLIKIKELKTLHLYDKYMLLFITVWFLIMVWLYNKTGYMSYRHIMPMVALWFAWLNEGLDRFVKLISKKQNYTNSIRILIIIAVIIFSVNIVTPIKNSKAYMKYAGKWFSENTLESERICVFDDRIGFYAERDYYEYPKDASVVDTEGCKFAVAIRGSKASNYLTKLFPITKTGSEIIEKEVVVFKIY